MYLNFYRFTQHPFQLTPDPTFLLLSPSHKEALTSILYGIENRKGIIVILGNMGTGKTTVVRSYIQDRQNLQIRLEGDSKKTSIVRFLDQKTDPERIKIIYIFFNSEITFKDILQMVYQELGMSWEDVSLLSLVSQLQQRLIEEFHHGNFIALIVDEAQNMPLETLEQLRMLSNLETNKGKLIQIVLVGTPELGDKLDREELKHLRQRIELKITINPLTFKQSLNYIRHRLSQVMIDDDERIEHSVFSAAAMREIAAYAQGIPRILNIACEQVLIEGYHQQKKPVPASIAKSVIAELGGKQPTRSWLWRLAPAAGLLLVLGFVTFQGGRFFEKLRNEAFFQTHNVEAKTAKSESNGADLQLNHTLEKQPTLSPNMNSESEIPKETLSLPNAVVDAVTGNIESASAAMMIQEATPAENEPPGETMVADSQNADVTDAVPIPEPEPAIYRTVIVKEGDTLVSLCERVYGYMNAEIIKQILRLNPKIEDINFILAGEKIVFPAISGKKKKGGILSASPEDMMNQ